MLKEKIQDFIEKVKTIEGVSDCALVSRDGIMLGNSMSAEFNEPWFAAMSATLFASAESASGIIKVAAPERVTLTSREGSVAVIGAGEKLLLVAVLKSRPESSPSMTALEEMAREIGGSF
ncbi:putative regulator of Ras-like GTPase activity (Roadblock/LC7/MglB family) [Methanolinea mesophila]|uniref:roadblock/LC7 domain-containing protein n=1 Tax=Methanolinea mesophila TaxID=547055 RepID=UPI001AE3C3B0|nr:roadblock/LC7 domain-containing protein [Methanolinea mesophila]MBP1928265.1 putative regulator of Ras-like GTPase activity (Roadblock/LC7/MglB family) [Methanolinea mesophila]